MKFILTLIALVTLFMANSQNVLNKIDEKGLKQGFWSICSDTSSETGNYLNDKRSGQWVFYKNLRIIKILSYKSDTLNGYSMSFNHNGSLYRKFYYRNGKLNEKAEFYSSKGILLARYEYLNDNIVTVEYYAIDKESPPRNHGYTPTLDSDKAPR